MFTARTPALKSATNTCAAGCPFAGISPKDNPIERPGDCQPAISAGCAGSLNSIIFSPESPAATKPRLSRMRISEILLPLSTAETPTGFAGFCTSIICKPVNSSARKANPFSTVMARLLLPNPLIAPMYCGAAGSLASIIWLFAPAASQTNWLSANTSKQVPSVSTAASCCGCAGSLISKMVSPFSPARNAVCPRSAICFAPLRLVAEITAGCCGLAISIINNAVSPMAASTSLPATDCKSVIASGNCNSAMVCGSCTASSNCWTTSEFPIPKNARFPAAKTAFTLRRFCFSSHS